MSVLAMSQLKARLDWLPDSGDSFREQVISRFISLFSELMLSFHGFDRCKHKRIGNDGQLFKELGINVYFTIEGSVRDVTPLLLKDVQIIFGCGGKDNFLGERHFFRC